MAIYDKNKNYKTPPPQKDSLGVRILTRVVQLLIIIATAMWGLYAAHNVAPHWPRYKAPTPHIPVPKECFQPGSDCDLG